jgi:hypothetical protein
LSYRVLVRATAERDIAEAQIWYEAQQHGLARLFRAEFAAAVDKLRETPLIYVKAYRDVRRVVLHRFP